ncbi:branched-chain amino acid aminotransferase [Dermatophilus congolensis]|uniref:branched-chain amino acid aminotransferase n=1 Tax=Dermatophilus congolensis TaxID=1863 RepID=UPI001AAFE7F1|nr:branched-chain amino acid aminotransferase [Dermatophilus congolensis]MBO3142198.1 branched-chain amino acid aminotransferase [Dermatophilus congolensis]MBO3151190.1 branched-chain amino acid aminotransferase [Dermatophilus congolensis]MBO3161809.1 branched-chain amino acid aminotransferase [Dermatophilus congolensis]MBO3162473.1 branched-chain amino acid aminotransferase [Dermatophilus congolensis]MBO3176029.1 branched-chain amino acid aminotransferase [Dermatophilus congolensis]
MTAALDFAVEPNPNPATPEQRAQILSAPKFGAYFTDHMVTATWSEQLGWHEGRVGPYAPFSIDPAAGILHYGQAVFEGLKAYRHEDGSVWSFRPEANAERMASSCRRLALPELPTRDFIESITALVQVDNAWVPPFEAGESSLYLRPFVFASEAFLGVRPAREVTYALIASPAGAYFSGGVSPVTLWISTTYSRAGRGGTGAAKCGGNYASSLAGQLEGISRGAEQVVFLDSETQTFVDELGGMNIFFVYRDGRLVTPELTGAILEGVTRRSVLTLGAEMGLNVQERRVPVQEWKDGVASGEITEAFACGTAAVITPIGDVLWEGGAMSHGAPVVASKIRSTLLDVQYGRIEDGHGWMKRLV